MDKRSRVKSTIAGQRADKVPWEIGLAAPARAMVGKYYGDERLQDPAYFDTWVGNHFRSVGPVCQGIFHGLEEEVNPGLWRDGWGVVWDTRGLYGEGEWGRPVNQVLKGPSLDGFRFPDPPGDDAFAHYPKFIGENGEYFLVANGAYLFEVAWALRGMEALLVDMYRHPGFVDELMGGIVEHFLPLIERTLKYDIDAFAFGDDWGYQDGLLMGAKHWRRFIKPGMARMFAPIKRAGKVTHLHSDGNTTEILEDLIKIGLDVYNPFQPEVMDVFELKKRYGDRLCFHGGIGVQSLLPLGSPDEVRAQVRRMIEVVGAGGRYILSPSHTVLADTPVENIVALIETVRAQ